MVESLQVLTSVKDHRRKLAGSITHLGGLNADGTPWQLRRPRTINATTVWA